MVITKSSKEGAARPSVCKWCGETKELKAVLSEEEAAKPLRRAPLCEGPNIFVKEGSSQDPNGKKRSRDEKDENDKGNDSSSICPRKSMMLWTHGLHHLFLEAIDFLGPDNATPKKILHYMNYRGLTTKHINTHLQKHREFMKTVADKSVSNNPCQTNDSSLQMYPPQNHSSSSGTSLRSSNIAHYPSINSKPTNAVFQATQMTRGAGNTLDSNKGFMSPIVASSSNFGGGSSSKPPLVFPAANKSNSFPCSPAPTTQPPVARIKPRKAHEEDVMKNAPIVVNSLDQQNSGNGYLHDVIFYRPANKDIQLNGHNNNAPENRSRLPSKKSSNLQQGNNENCAMEPSTWIDDLFVDKEPNTNIPEDKVLKTMHELKTLMG